MAKAKEDKFTSEMFGNRPGRPRKVDAMTVAERVRKHRAKRKELALQVTKTPNDSVDPDASTRLGSVPY